MTTWPTTASTAQVTSPCGWLASIETSEPRFSYQANIGVVSRSKDARRSRNACSRSSTRPRDRRRSRTVARGTAKRDGEHSRARAANVRALPPAYRYEETPSENATGEQWRSRRAPMSSNTQRSGTSWPASRNARTS